MSNRVLVLASGGGSTFERLHQDIKAGLVDAEIAGVVCNKSPDSEKPPGVYEIANGLNVPIHHIVGASHDSYVLDDQWWQRIPYTQSDEEAGAIDELARSEGVAAIFMMGYMRRARQKTPTANWHPGPLPQTAGKMLSDAQAECMRLGLEYSGPTVHWMDPRPGKSGVPEYDNGSVITHTPFRIGENHRKMWNDKEDVDALSKNVVELEKENVAGSASRVLWLVNHDQYPRDYREVA